MNLNYELFNINTGEIVCEGTQTSLLKNFSASFTGTDELDQFEINFILMKDLHITCYLDKYKHEPWLINIKLKYKDEYKSFNTFEQVSSGRFVKDEEDSKGEENIKITYIRTENYFVIKDIYFEEDVFLRYDKSSDIEEVALRIFAGSWLDFSSIIYDTLLQKAIVDFNSEKWSKSISNLLICLEVNKDNNLCIDYLTSAYYYNEEYDNSLKYLNRIYDITKDEKYILDMISIFQKTNDALNIEKWVKRVKSKAMLEELKDMGI